MNCGQNNREFCMLTFSRFYFVAISLVVSVLTTGCASVINGEYQSIQVATRDIKGEAVVAFVVLKGARPKGEVARKIVAELREWVAKEIGPIAKPDEIRFGDNLPKTRSGKIMRRLLRAIARGEAITQDISTLENPAILEQLKETIS